MILTANKNEYLGNTLKAAAMHVFKKSSQSDIKIWHQGSCVYVSVRDGSKWNDYDTWMQDGNHNFLIAQ